MYGEWLLQTGYEAHHTAWKDEMDRRSTILAEAMQKQEDEDDMAADPANPSSHQTFDKEEMYGEWLV